MHFVYILYSQKLQKFYTGYTSNLETRMDFHLHDSQTRKFTHNATDWAIVFSLACNSKNQALLIEKHIKAMKGKVYIQNGIAYPEMAATLLQK